MKFAKISDMTKGWFIGNFEPSLCKTNDCEVAVKRYKAGEKEDRHYHKVATEFTVIVEGNVRMNDVILGPGDIIVMEPGEATDFEALTDATNVVVKMPGASNDKYICEGKDDD